MVYTSFIKKQTYTQILHVFNEIKHNALDEEEHIGLKKHNNA